MERNRTAEQQTEVIMKLEQTWIQLEKDAIKKEKHGRINVILCKMYRDAFGKYSTQTSIFDDFVSVASAYDRKNTLEAQARNCSDASFVGWRL